MGYLFGPLDEFMKVASHQHQDKNLMAACDDIIITYK